MKGVSMALLLPYGKMIREAEWRTIGVSIGRGQGRGREIQESNASRHRSLHHDSHTFPIVIQSEDI